MITARSALRLGIWVISCISAALAVMPAADASLPRFFPVLESGIDEFLGLSLVNTADSVNTVTITWTSGDGSSSRAGMLTLPPGTQRARLVREFLGTPDDPRDGWIRIQSSTSGLLSYLTSGTGGLLDGVEPVSQPASMIFLGHVSVYTGFAELDHTDTFVTLVNPGNEVADARAELIGLDGRSAGTRAIQVPAFASRTLRVSEAFREALPANNLGGRSFAGYMKVVSDVRLAGWLRIETPLSRRLLRGRPIEEIEPSPLAVAGHFASGGGELYRSGLNLINTGDVPAQLELAAQDDRGGHIGSAVRLTLGPGQGIREDVLRLFDVAVPAVFPPPLITGYIRIRSADGSPFRLVGDVDISSDGNAAAMLFPVATAASRNWVIPFAVSGAEYFTGCAFANPNELLTVQTDVTVDLLDPDGLSAAPRRTIPLSPAARFAGLVEKEIRGGYLQIQASGPVFTVGSIGTTSGNALAFLPAYRTD